MTKKAYQSPRLTRLGSVAELTQTFGKKGGCWFFCAPPPPPTCKWGCGDKLS